MADEKKKKKKSDIRVDSGGTVEEVVSEHSSMKKEKKKKKKNREIKDDFAGEDGDIAERESEKLGEDALVKKKKSKKQRIDSEAEDAAVKKKKSKKKNKETKVDSEAEDGVKKKSKKESGSDVIGKSESSKVCEEPLVHTDDANKKKGKRKREDTDLGAEENRDNEMKRKSKKKKLRVDSEVEETSLNSTNDAKKKSKEEKTSEDSEVKENNKDSTKDSKKEKKKKKKEKKQGVDSEVEVNNLNSTKDVKKKSKEKRPSEDSEVEENNKDSTKDAKTKQSVDSEAEEKDLISTKDAKKKRKEKKQSEDSEAEENGLNSPKDAKKKSKKKKKKKQSEVSEAEENNNDGKDAKKKRKKKQESGKSDKDVTTPSSKSTKRVKFSDQVEFFPAEDEETAEEDVEEEVKVVRGKRFTKEEDELVKNAVLEYIDNHALGDEGIDMVMECKSHPQLKGCWKEIASALPWRTYMSVYNRAHTIFEAGSKGVWTEEDFELVKDFQKKHGNDWRTLADAMGKHRKHVKDAWRRIRLASKNKGHWTREEYQVLFDLVNKDLRMKAFKEKHAKHGMLRDSIPWMAISDVLGTRDHVTCCTKWYDQLTSPMVAKGLWANVDDYRLLEELLKLDAACIDDVDWDNLLDNRDGEACRKRFHQMVLHIGVPKSKTFAEQVEILSDRYRPDLAEDREDFDNRPYDPED